jgi:hypothetical protein
LKIQRNANRLRRAAAKRKPVEESSRLRDTHAETTKNNPNADATLRPYALYKQLRAEKN